MEDFDRGDMDKREQIRDLLTAGVEDFYQAAIAILKNPPGLRSLQFLVVLLVANDLLMRALCDPLLPHGRALELARLALRVDAMADVTLARALADTVETLQEPAELANAARLLNILDEVSNGTRIFSSLMRILRHPDASLRSKAVLIIGRGNKSVKWVHQRLSDSDSRIRANAVESLWGLDTDQSRELLRSMLRDADSRVAGNALLALHMLGERSAIGEIWRMFENPSPTILRNLRMGDGRNGGSAVQRGPRGYVERPLRNGAQAGILSNAKTEIGCRCTGSGTFVLPHGTNHSDRRGEGTAHRAGDRHAAVRGSSPDPADSYRRHRGWQTDHCL